jgi:hypothetical protein
MINVDIVKGKSKIITENIKENIINNINNTNITFIAQVKIEYLKEKYWSNKFKADNIYTIDNIAYEDLINFQDAKIKILKGIYWDNSDNNKTVNASDIILNLLDKKYNSLDKIEIKNIKNTINYVHGLLLLKDKLKKYIKNKDNLDTFLEYNKPLLFGYYKRKIDSDYNIYIRKRIELNYTNV